MNDYEKKYKEALEVAKRKLCFDKAGMVDSFTPNDIYEMFPELKESEDEKIRKELIGFLRNIPNSNYTCEEMALWLEKQGGQKQETNYPKFDFSDILAIHCCMETAEKVTEDKELYEKLKSLHSRLHDAYWIEKQSDKPQGKTALEAINEEKVNNANKVEPKDYSSIDPHFGKPIDKVEPKFKVKYAGNEYNVLEVKDIAGVTFYGIEDEPNHIDYVKAENCERVDGYNIKESGSLYPTKSAMFSKQNPIDKIDTKLNDNSVSNELRAASFAHAEKELKNQTFHDNLEFELIYTFEEGAKWNAAQKPAWSNKDKKILDELINFFANMVLPKDHDFRIYASWLKALKAQNEHKSCTTDE